MKVIIRNLPDGGILTFDCQDNITIGTVKKLVQSQTRIDMYLFDLYQGAILISCDKIAKDYTNLISQGGMGCELNIVYKNPCF